MPQAAILDIDGTLVDTNYHHAIAWYRAFRQHDVTLPIWQIHRGMGMGGDQLVAYLAGDEVEQEKGDDIRAAEKALYLAFIEEIEPFEDARQFIVDLRERGLTVVLASSAKANELDHYLDLLDVRDVASDWTSSADVETTKPSPDIVESAFEKAGTKDAVMVGDTPWDIKAAARAGIETVAVLTGGFSADELREAGAAEVYESIGELRRRIADSALG